VDDAIAHALSRALDELEEGVLALEESQDPSEAADLRDRLSRLEMLARAADLPDMDLPLPFFAQILDWLAAGRLQLGAEVPDALLQLTDMLRRWLFLFTHSDCRVDQDFDAPTPGDQALEQLPPTAAGETDLSGLPHLREQGEGEGAPEPRKPSEGRTENRDARQASIKVPTDKLDRLMHYTSELVILQAIISHTAPPGGAADTSSGAPGEVVPALKEFGHIIDNLRREVMIIRMVPLRPLFMKMNRIVRQVAQTTGKNIVLELEGADTELDRGAVEDLDAPLVHLVRNAADHGIEDPGDRTAAGKPETGTIRLQADRTASEVRIRISDDGKGLDTDVILDKAVQKGLADPGRSYSRTEIFDFILQPGFSTSATVSDISGRGVGLDVALREVQRSGGALDIDSTPGTGTVFTISLPLERTMAEGISDGVVLSVGNELFVVPTEAVRQVFFPRGRDVFSMQGRREVIRVRESYCPVVRLHEILDIAPLEDRPWKARYVIVSVGGKQWALMADAVVGKQLIVRRRLEQRLFGATNVISGYAMMGERSGLVLNLESILAQGTNGNGPGNQTDASPVSAAAAGPENGNNR
jgi:two-component system chemotaxis sensor kinase CheA